MRALLRVEARPLRLSGRAPESRRGRQRKPRHRAAHRVAVRARIRGGQAHARGRRRHSRGRRRQHW